MPLFLLFIVEIKTKKREAMPPPQKVLFLHNFDGAELFLWFHKLHDKKLHSEHNGDYEQHPQTDVSE